MNQEPRKQNQERSPSHRDGDVLVRVEGVSKKFCRSLKKSLWYGVQDLTTELIGGKGHHDALRPGEFWAVNDVSFELRRGECLGLIGHNGAGKTTLLKMLNGLIKPDSGRIEMRGRVSALIALGAGFNPILTGRENIYVNASVLGMTKAEIDSKIDAIIDFAEIREFIDAPVQSYSSGMAVRLGFSIATTVVPDVLILDEVLAVGDAGFRAKCYDRLRTLSQECAVIFVSHSMSQVARLCTQSLLLHHGSTFLKGMTTECIVEYERLQQANQSTSQVRHGTGEARFEEIIFEGEDGNPSNTIHFGHPVVIQFGISAKAELEDVVIDLTFRSASGELAAECNNYVCPARISLKSEGVNQVRAHIASLSLNPGSYTVSAFLTDSEMLTHFDWWESVCPLSVVGARPAIAGSQIRAVWNNQSH